MIIFLFYWVKKGEIYEKEYGTIDRIIRILLAIVVFILYMTAVLQVLRRLFWHSGICIYNNEPDRFLPLVRTLQNFDDQQIKTKLTTMTKQMPVSFPVTE